MYLARTLDQISQSSRAAFKKYLPGTDSNIVQNVLYGFRKTLALALKEVDLRSKYLYDQLFSFTADDYHNEFRHAPEVGLKRKPAGFAVGLIDLDVSSAVALPSGLRFLSGGVVYYSTDDVAATGAGTVQVPVKALTAGIAANRVAGEKMSLSEPGLYPAAAPVGVVSTGEIAGGSEKESIESLKTRIQARKANPPQGGNEPDYEGYAENLSFVSRSWARRPTGGPGALSVWFLNAQGDLPSQSEIDQLLDALHSMRMLGPRDLSVHAPIDDVLTVQVRLDPDTADLRERVTVAVKSAVAERARPGLPPTRPQRPDDEFVLSKSWISEAVSTVVGEDSHVLQQPANDISYPVGHMPLTVNVEFV